MQDDRLPTADDILGRALGELDHARGALSDARDELKSDHRPLGTPLPAGHADARSTALRDIGTAKDAIDHAKSALWEALGSGAARPVDRPIVRPGRPPATNRNPRSDRRPAQPRGWAAVDELAGGAQFGLAANGPYETERDAMRASLWHSLGRDAGMEIDEANLTSLGGELFGIEVGAYDERILQWLADHEPSTVAVVCGLISRARTAGRASQRAADVKLARDNDARYCGPGDYEPDVQFADLPEAGDE